MQSLHVKVDPALCEESCDALRTFLSGLAGVASISMQGADISIAYDERKIPAEQLLAMTRSSAEMLGHHLRYG